MNQNHYHFREESIAGYSMLKKIEVKFVALRFYLLVGDAVQEITLAAKGFIPDNLASQKT